MPEPKKVVLINAVGLTPALLAHAPVLSRLAAQGDYRPMTSVFPAVTLSAQASMLTGTTPSEHGVVGNGWYRRELGEVRFWVQSDQQMQGEILHDAARRLAGAQGRTVKIAHLFWWFAQGIRADLMLTPKPHYSADGGKAFDIMSTPEGLGKSLEAKHGRFPFHTFWGPMAGLPCSDWIADASSSVVRDEVPDLTLIYLPHLDYDLQRFGDSGTDLLGRVGELDSCIETIALASEGIGAKLIVVSEYGICDVSRPVYVNRVLREAGLLKVRGGPFGEMLDTMGSDAFAVCDHQAAHVYVRDTDKHTEVAKLLAALPGVARALHGDEREALGVNHVNAGEIVLESDADAWFAYPYWLDDAEAPDFARTIDIHRKPGYDPCELFFDPKLAAPKLRVMRKLIAKKLGMRTLLDVVPTDASLVKGSHGRISNAPEKGPLLLSNDGALVPPKVAMTDVKGLVLRAMGLGLGETP